MPGDHQDNVRNVCRLCCRVMPDRRTPKEKFQTVIKRAMDIDLDDDDESIHPSHLCGSCDRKLQRWKECQRKKRKVALNITLHPFEPHGDSCSLCEKFESVTPDVQSLLQDIVEQYSDSGISFQHQSKSNCTLVLFLDDEGNTMKLLTVYEDTSWSIRVYGKLMTTYHSDLSALPSQICSNSDIKHLLDHFVSMKVCPGNKEYNTISDERLLNVPVYRHMYPGECTVRHNNCSLLMPETSKRCVPCAIYRSTLASILKSEQCPSTSQYTSYKNLPREELEERLRQSKIPIKTMKKKIKTLEDRLDRYVVDAADLSSDETGEEPGKPEEVNFKEKYRSLKRKMRFLIYEQECFQEELRRAQRKLLKVSRDKNFLLDRLLQYERVIDPGTDSDSTLSSEDSCKETKKEQEKKVVKKKQRRPKKKPARRLQGTPMLGANRDPLPHDLHNPPQALHQQLPHLAELMRKAAEGLPITHIPTMQVPGSTSGGPTLQQQQPPPSLPSPHPMLSPHQPHPSLLSPTGSLGMGLPMGPPGVGAAGGGLDPRVFDRGLQHAFLPPGLMGGMGMGLGPPMMAPGDGGMPQMDLNALTAAAALDKVNQERSRKKSKKDTSDKHSAASQGPSTSQHQVPLPHSSTSSVPEDNQDLVIDVSDGKHKPGH